MPSTGVLEHTVPWRALGRVAMIQQAILDAWWCAPTLSVVAVVGEPYIVAVGFTLNSVGTLCRSMDACKFFT